MDQLTLTTPITPPPITTYTLGRVDLNLPERYLLVQLVANTGAIHERVWRDGEADTQIATIAALPVSALAAYVFGQIGKDTPSLLGTIAPRPLVVAGAVESPL